MQFYGEELTVQRVVDSYRFTGYTPIDQCFIGKRRRCCALSAVMLASDVVKPEELEPLNHMLLAQSVPTLTHESGATKAEVISFMNGFDGHTPSEHGLGYGVDEAAFKLGCEVRAAVPLESGS